MCVVILGKVSSYIINCGISNPTILSYIKNCGISNPTISSYIINRGITNPTIYDVRWDLVPLPKLPHLLCNSHLVSSLDNLTMAYIQGRNM